MGAGPVGGVAAGAGRRVGGVGTGVTGRPLRIEPGVDGARGTMASIGVGGRGIAGLGGGCEAGGISEPRVLAGASPVGVAVRARLYSRQHVGQRHSTTSEPSGAL